MRWVGGAVVPCRVGLPRLWRFGDTIRWIGTAAQMGRSSDTMMAKCLANGCRTVLLGTLCDTMRWPGLGRVAKGWDVDSRRTRVKGRWGVYGFHGRPGSGSPEAQCFSGYIRGTGRHLRRSRWRSPRFAQERTRHRPSSLASRLTVCWSR